jgi:hypothetical protein
MTTERGPPFVCNGSRAGVLMGCLGGESDAVTGQNPCRVRRLGRAASANTAREQKRQGAHQAVRPNCVVGEGQSRV